MPTLQEKIEQDSPFLTQDYFPFLPNQGIFLIDTCSFSLNHRNPFSNQGSRNNGNLTPESCIEKYSRLHLLTIKLASMDNWLTTQEVLEEYKNGTKGLIKIITNLRGGYSSLSAEIERLVKQKEETYNEILCSEHINANENLTEEEKTRIKQILPRVEKVFQGFKGKVSKLNTDCKLIATALIFAKQEPTSIFSQDYPLLNTFCYCAQNLNLPINPESTYVISEARGEQIPSKEFLGKRKPNYLPQKRQSHPSLKQPLFHKPLQLTFA